MPYKRIQSLYSTAAHPYKGFMFWDRHFLRNQHVIESEMITKKEFEFLKSLYDSRRDTKLIQRFEFILYMLAVSILFLIPIWFVTIFYWEIPVIWQIMKQYVQQQRNNKFKLLFIQPRVIQSLIGRGWYIMAFIMGNYV